MAESREWRLVKITVENQKMFSHCIPDTYKKHLFERGMSAIGAVDGQGEGCGAVVACVEDENIRILWVYVEPKQRRKGIGSDLLGEVKNALIRRKKREGRLFIEYPYPKMRELELLLLRSGFFTEAETNRIYYVPACHLKDSELLEKPVFVPDGEELSLKEMTPEQKLLWLHRFGKDLPQELSPQNAGGILLEGESFASVDKGHVQAFALCSRLEDASVYLAALYCEKRAVRAMTSLLQKTLGAVLERYGDQIFCFSAATDGGKRLAEHLCRGHEDKIEIQTIRISTWIEDKEQVGYESFAWRNLMPRLNGLEALLRDLGMEVSRMPEKAERFPGLQADIEGETIRFFYAPAGPLDQERFILNLESVAFEGQEGKMEWTAVCQAFNLENHFAVAIFDVNRGQVIARHMIPELGGIPAGENLDLAVCLFLDSLRQLKLQKL